jgi:hypothetical protein
MPFLLFIKIEWVMPKKQHWCWPKTEHGAKAALGIPVFDTHTKILCDVLWEARPIKHRLHVVEESPDCPRILVDLNLHYSDLVELVNVSHMDLNRINRRELQVIFEHHAQNGGQNEVVEPAIVLGLLHMTSDGTTSVRIILAHKV